MTKKPVESWIKQNSWNLLVTIVSIVIAFTIANYKINAMEAKIAEYPSYDYFELKFQVIQNQLDKVETKLDTHTGQ